MSYKTWSKEKPTKPGVYMLAILWDDGEWSIDWVEVISTDEGLFVWEFGTDKDTKLDELVGVQIQWRGPFPSVQPPKVEEGDPLGD